MRTLSGKRTAGAAAAAFAVSVVPYQSAYGKDDGCQQKQPDDDRCQIIHDPFHKVRLLTFLTLQRRSGRSFYRSQACTPAGTA